MRTVISSDRKLLSSDRKYYLAPLEGLTGYIYRRAYHQYFGGIDRYFTPFIKPNQYGHLSSRERNDILPENNHGMQVVPQILTNNAEDFIETAAKLQQYGYKEVNLNLGCPSKTVINKKRGSGFLAFPEELDAFLEEVFTKSKVGVSIKTRIGKENPDEFAHLMEIYNKYPLTELIVHPRVQQDFYKNTPNLSVFMEALQAAKMPVCYNGDICSRADYQNIIERCPQLALVMIGRGILANPNLIGLIKGDLTASKEIVRRFHNHIYADYKEVMSGERNVLYKMKELWFYLQHSFTNSDKYAKKIRKSGRLAMYEDTVESLFEEQELIY